MEEEQMELDMKTRKKLTGIQSKRYQKARKKAKTKILDEFIAGTGYNRKYALHLLANWGKTKQLTIDGKAVKLTAKKPKKAKANKGGRPKKYGDDVIAVVCKIWEFFDYQCGKLLAPLIKLMIDFLVAEPEFGINNNLEIRKKLLEISASTIDRRLKSERKKLEIRGKSLTKPGKLLKNQIPVRTYFTWDERKPGFFELDTVSHCGANSSGEFCSTLTLTDVCAGWVEVRGLRNRAHIRVKLATMEVRDTLPFPLLGIDSDNGGEFINEQLKSWCDENHIQFTRSRPYRKNDNCFVEQKNGDIVRKTVGYYRYDTDAETEALQEVYKFLCPLVNYWYPSIKIKGKERLKNGKYKKNYDVPKTPYQRLLESPDISNEAKDELRRRAALINPVTQKRLVNRALARLLKLNKEKYITDLVSNSSETNG
jgi:hypothetical protein